MNSIIDINKTELGSAEPVTLAEAKMHCIITFDDDDALLTALITQARQAVENFTLVSITSKRIVMTAVLEDEWELPYGPVIGIESVATPSGNPGSGPATYETDSSNWMTDGVLFASFHPAYCKRYQITYTAGYSTMPPALKLAILNEIAYRYQHRGEESITGICDAAEALAMPFKRMAFQ